MNGDGSLIDTTFDCWKILSLISPGICVCSLISSLLSLSAFSRCAFLVLASCLLASFLYKTSVTVVGLDGLVFAITNWSKYQPQICILPWFSSKHLVNVFASTSQLRGAHALLWELLSLAWLATALSACSAGPLDPPNIPPMACPLHFQIQYSPIKKGKGASINVWEVDEL